MSRRARVALALTALLVPAVLTATGSSAADVVTVAVRDFSFDPQTIETPAGAVVTWHVVEGNHTVTADDASYDSGVLGTDMTFSHRFVEPGLYRYRCTFHGNPDGTGMSGLVRVLSAPTPSTTQPPTTTTTQPPRPPTTAPPTTTFAPYVTTTTPPYTPTTTGPEVTLVSSSDWASPGSSYRHVVGEVRNTGDVNVYAIEVNLEFYDAGGTLLATDRTYVHVGILAPGDLAGFDSMFAVPPGYQHYSVTISAEPTSQDPNHNFTVRVTNRFTTAGGYEHIVGQVTNDNATNARLVSVYSTFYDASGRAVGQEHTFVNGDELGPGQTGSYEFIRSSDEPRYVGHRIFADSPTAPSPPPAKSRPFGAPAPQPVTPDPAPIPEQPNSAPAPEQPTPAGRGGSSGYWMVGAGGRVFAFGDARHLGEPRDDLGRASAVDLEPTPSGRGYWVIDDAGRIYTYGDAPYFGGADLARLAKDEKVTSLSATPSGGGYWIFTTKGRVLARGDAEFLGDVSAVALNGPVLDSISTPSGLGYYMVASDGGIFSFGDARFYGSMGGTKLNAPVQSLVPDGDGQGYWLVAADGGIFSFDAPFHGSMGHKRLNKPVTGMVRFGDGYLMVGEDGGIFNFSSLPFYGSLGADPPARPIVSVATLEG